jgi:hypothetical protein
MNSAVFLSLRLFAVPCMYQCRAAYAAIKKSFLRSAVTCVHELFRKQCPAPCNCAACKDCVKFSTGKYDSTIVSNSSQYYHCKQHATTSREREGGGDERIDKPAVLLTFIYWFISASGTRRRPALDKQLRHYIIAPAGCSLGSPRDVEHAHACARWNN